MPQPACWPRHNTRQPGRFGCKPGARPPERSEHVGRPKCRLLPGDPVSHANARIVVVVADGLRADVAAQAMGFVGALMESGQAASAQLRCSLPSLSRPLYASLITGETPLEHGIVSNQQIQACGPSLFDDALAAGQRCAVVAYHWFYELLAGRAFEPLVHRLASVPERGVIQASWYFEDPYPDSHTLADAEALRLGSAPDLLFVHPMGPDDSGHRHGGESDGYRHSVRQLDMALALVVPRWWAAGYDVVLTSDHGMGADRMHGGRSDAERLVPFFWMPTPGPAQARRLQWTLPAQPTALRAFLSRHRADHAL